MGYYICFSAKKLFSIQIKNQRWDGIIEYSYDNKQWQEWHGERLFSRTIYMRGINNTVINRLPNVANVDFHCFVINGNNVECNGNIENLLDYKSVMKHKHPKMSNHAFLALFLDCQALTKAPQLLANKLSEGCYSTMFKGCLLHYLLAF